MSCITSQGHPTDIGLQLGKACYFVAGKRVKRECFYFFCFLTFTPVPLSSLSLSLISSISSISFLPFSGRQHKMTTRVDVSLNPNTINQSNEYHNIHIC